MLKLIHTLNFFPISAYSFTFTNALAGGAFMTPANTTQIDKNIGKWIGGKTTGKIDLIGSEYVIKSGHKVFQKFDKASFGTKELAEMQCKKYLYEFCKDSGKLINEYRYCYDYPEHYLEVKVGKLQIKVDVECLGLIEKYEWFYHMSHKFVYRKDKAKKIKLVADVLELPKGEVQVEHIDGDYLNYRKKNLRAEVMILEKKVIGESKK